MRGAEENKSQCHKGFRGNLERWEEEKAKIQDKEGIGRRDWCLSKHWGHIWGLRGTQRPSLDKFHVEGLKRPWLHKNVKILYLLSPYHPKNLANVNRFLKLCELQADFVKPARRTHLESSQQIQVLLAPKKQDIRRDKERRKGGIAWMVRWWGERTWEWQQWVWGRRGGGEWLWA